MDPIEFPDVPPNPPVEKLVEPPSPPGPPSELLEHEGFVISVFAPPPPPPAPPRELVGDDPVDPCAAHAPIWVIGDPSPKVDMKTG